MLEDHLAGLWLFIQTIVGLLAVKNQPLNFAQILQMCSSFALVALVVISE